MPKLAAFPKAYLDDLCVNGTMTIRQWIDLAATLDLDGFEADGGGQGPCHPHALLLAGLHPCRPIVSAGSDRQTEALDRHGGWPRGILLPRAVRPAAAGGVASRRPGLRRRLHPRLP